MAVQNQSSSWCETFTRLSQEEDHLLGFHDYGVDVLIPFEGSADNYPQERN